MLTSPRPPSFSFVYSLGAGLVRSINKLCYLVVFLKAIKEKTAYEEAALQTPTPTALD